MYTTLRFVACTAWALFLLGPQVATAQMGWTVVHPPAVKHEGGAPGRFYKKTLEERPFGHERHKRDQILHGLVEKYRPDEDVEIAECGALFHVYRWVDGAKEQAEYDMSTAKQAMIAELRTAFALEKRIGSYILKEAAVDCDPAKNGGPYSVVLKFLDAERSVPVEVRIEGTVSSPDTQTIPPPNLIAWETKQVGKVTVHWGNSANGARVFWQTGFGHRFTLSGIAGVDDPLLKRYLDTFPPRLQGDLGKPEQPKVSAASDPSTTLTPQAEINQAIRLDGTATCFRALVEISEQYARLDEETEFEIRYGGAFGAVEKLGKREIDIGVVEFPLVRHVDKAWAKTFPDGTGPAAEYTFAQTALGVVVNKRNPLTKLTHAQMKDIWSGEIRTWQALGGSGARIRVLTSNALSGTMVSDMILYYGSWRDQIERLAADTNVIASVMGDASAIGFVALTPDLPEDVKLAAVAREPGTAAVRPTVENVVLERYPLVRQYKFLLTDQSPPAAYDFAEFACSEQTQAIVQQWGLFPATIRAEAEAQQRVDEVKDGKGVEVSVVDLAGGEDTLKERTLAFARAKAAVQLKVQKVRSAAEAVERFKAGQVELLVADDTLELGEEQEPQAEGKGIERIELGRLEVGIVVHPENVLEWLEPHDVRDILSGAVQRWPAAHGPGTRIYAFGLGSTHPATQLLREKLGRQTPLDYRAQADSQRVILSVARDPAAIGFIDVSRLPAHEKSVRLVPVRVRKEAGGPLGDESPLWRAMILYVSPAASDMANQFAAFLTSGKEEGGKRNERQDMPGSQGEAGQEVSAAVADASGAGDGQMDAAGRQDAHGNMESEIAARLGLNGAAAEPVARGIAENAQAEPVPPDTDHPSARPQHVEPTEAEKTQAISPVLSEDSTPHPTASKPRTTEADFTAWITAHAVPVGLGGMGVVAFAVVLGTFSMKRARHRSEVMRRYRP